MSGLASDLTQNHQNLSTIFNYFWNDSRYFAAGYFTSPCHLRLDSDLFKPMHKVVRSGTSQDTLRQEKTHQVIDSWGGLKNPKDFQKVIGADWWSLPKTPDMAGYLLNASQYEKQIVEHGRETPAPHFSAAAEFSFEQSTWDPTTLCVLSALRKIPPW